MISKKGLFYVIAIGINVSAFWKYIIVNMVDVSNYGFGVVFSQICEILIPALSLVGLLVCLRKKGNEIKHVVISVCVLGIVSTLTMAVWGRYWNSPYLTMILLCLVNITAISFSSGVDHQSVKHYFSLTMLFTINICHFLWFFDLLIANPGLFFHSFAHTIHSISIVIGMIFFVAMIIDKQFESSKDVVTVEGKKGSRSKLPLPALMIVFYIIGLVLFLLIDFRQNSRFNLWFVSIAPVNLIVSYLITSGKILNIQHPSRVTNKGMDQVPTSSTKKHLQTSDNNLSISQSG